MMIGRFTLPEGRRGQALAVAMSGAALALIWLALPGPLLGWYQDRAATLAQQQALAARMTALAQEIPQLRQAVNQAGLQAGDNQVLLPGNTDAIAGANLQTALQTLATNAGTSLDSAALLPAQNTGSLQRISMQVSVTASWPVLVALLQGISTAQPRMIVGDFSVTATQAAIPGQEPPLGAQFTVFGFRAGGS